MGQIDLPMYEYHGSCGPNRLLQQDLLEFEIEDRLHFLTGLPLEELCPKVAVEPYSMDNPWPVMSYLTPSMSFMLWDVFI